MIPEVPRAALDSFQVIVDQDDGRPCVGSLSVRLSRSQGPHTQGSLWKFQDYEWSDEAGVRETLSILAHSLGLDLAKRLVYRVQE